MSRYKNPYTLYKRGKYWYYRTYTPDGIRTVAKTTGQTSKPLAKKYCDGLFLSGMLWTSERTFGDYAAHFYDDNSLYFKDRIVPLSENTIKNYQKNMRLLIMPFFKNVKLCDINYTRLKQFRSSLIERGYSALSIQQTMSVLKHIIDTAYRDRLIPVNPYDLIEPIKLKQSFRDAFTLEEVAFLYSHISEEFKDFIVLLALTGCRISEAVGLTPDRVKKTQSGVLYVEIDRQFNNGKYKPVKGQLVRSVPLIPEIVDCIGFQPTRLSAFYRAFLEIKPQFERAEERLLCFHSLRHFFITNAKSYGIQERKVEYLAGHSPKEKIVKTYTNFKIDDVLEILEWQQERIKNVRCTGKDTTDKLKLLQEF